MVRTPVFRAFGILALLATAAVLRIWLLPRMPELDDEKRFEEMAASISFSPGEINLPLRGRNHPAFVPYVVKASTALFGTSIAARRGLHALAGVTMILVVFLLARDCFGHRAALWAASLLAFNEYHFQISSVGTSHAPFLLCVSVAVFCFVRFLRDERPVWLYGAAAAMVPAFYTKELAALLLPVFGWALLQNRYRVWWTRPTPYLAFALFAVFIAPDVAWNLLGRGDAEQASYGDHLSRIGGIQLSLHPLAFYGRQFVRQVSLSAMGMPFYDPVPEYLAMNAVSGAVLLAGVVAMAVQARQLDSGQRLLLSLFVLVFGFFSLIRPGHPERHMDPVSWAWVDMTFLPAAVLAGAWLAQRRRWPGILLKTVALAGMAYAVFDVLSRFPERFQPG